MRFTLALQFISISWVYNLLKFVWRSARVRLFFPKCVRFFFFFFSFCFVCVLCVCLYFHLLLPLRFSSSWCTLIFFFSSFSPSNIFFIFIQKFLIFNPLRYIESESTFIAIVFCCFVEFLFFVPNAQRASERSSQMPSDINLFHIAKIECLYWTWTMRWPFVCATAVRILCN